MARKVVAQRIALILVPHGEFSASLGPNCPSMARCRFSYSGWCVQARDHHFENDVSSDPSELLREKLWRELFSDLPQWWVHTSGKVHPRYQDFKREGTRQGLWIIGNLPMPWVKAELATERHVSPDIVSERKMMREKLWRQFFSDPSQWWDHRSEKIDPKYPDFKHKKTGQSLWLVDRLTPPWVEVEFARMAPGILQSHIFSWHVRLRRHVEAGEYKRALHLFQQMQREGMMPNKFTFIPVLNACSNLRSLVEGKRIHEQIIQTGCGSDIYIATCLINMYAKCRSIEDAWIVFNKMRQRDVVSWSAMIVGYVKSGQGLKALELFRQMQQEGVEPNTVTFVGALNACAIVPALEEGRRVHEHIIRRSCESDVYVANCLVDMYGKCGSIEDAWIVFKNMRERTVISWNVMIGGYVKCEQGLKALDLFRRMQQEGVEPDAVTFVGLLNACASVAAFEKGRRVHEQIIRRGFQSDVCIANSLVDMYGKCGSIEDAWSVFTGMPERSVFSWTAMIMGYVKSEHGLKALELFQKMQQEGVEPNSVTFVGVLNACTSIAALEEGRHVHKQIIFSGYESDVYVANCLVDMYAKCGSIEDAWSVFNRMHERTVVTWSAMITGYVKSEQGLKALELFQKMQQEGLEPDTISFVGALNACASFAAPKEGRRVHKQIIQRGYESDVYVGNCLIDMYAKCGSTKDARIVFNQMRERNVVSWNTMIGGYAMHGDSDKAIDFFKKMCKEDVEIDEITFICLLSACSHGGLVEEGLGYFKTMTSHYDILPTRKHYSCMVDLLGRAGRLEEAEKLAEEISMRMPMELDNYVWMSILGACRIHGNLEVAERAARRCLELDPNNASANVLLSNIYAAAGKWDRSATIQGERFKRDVRKVSGRTWIEVKNVVHSFVVDDKEHPEILQILAEFDRLSVQLNEEGYIPDRRFLSLEEKEESHLCCHSERVTIAYELRGSPNLIKNVLQLSPLSQLCHQVHC